MRRKWQLPADRSRCLTCHEYAEDCECDMNKGILKRFVPWYKARLSAITRRHSQAKSLKERTRIVRNNAETKPQRDVPQKDDN